MSIKVPAFLQKKLRITCRKIYSEGWQNCLVYGDEDRIVEVMQNLIENAVKYGNGGYLGIKSEDEEVTAVMLMEAGMGLYICRKILHMMDGEIFAENKDGCFNVTVVLKKV